MLFRFCERKDDGAHVVAMAHVAKGAVIWGGPEADLIRSMLRGQTWRVLGDQRFDESRADHWRRLPRIFSGIRFWVNAAPGGELIRK